MSFTPIAGPTMLLKLSTGNTLTGPARRRRPSRQWDGK